VQGANHKVDGAFVATILETASVVALYFAWRSITEGPCRRLHFALAADHTYHRVVGGRGVLLPQLDAAGRLSLTSPRRGWSCPLYAPPMPEEQEKSMCPAAE
jgi:hypothetical protein